MIFGLKYMQINNFFTLCISPSINDILKYFIWYQRKKNSSSLRTHGQQHIKYVRCGETGAGCIICDTSNTVRIAGI